MMNDTVARIVDLMFEDTEMNEEVAALRDEVMNNCQERYNDLVSSGVNEDDAIEAVVESLRGLDDVIAQYRRKSRRAQPAVEFSPAEEDASETGVRDLVFSPMEIHRIDLTLVSEDVELIQSDDGMYHVKWEADAEETISCRADNGTLRVERIAGMNYAHRGHQQRGHMYVHGDEINTNELEQTLNGMGDAINEAVSSVGSMFEGLGRALGRMFSSAKRAFSGCDTVTISIPHSAVPHVKLLTTSGDLEVTNVALADLSVVSTSGDVSINLDEREHVERIEARSTSGDIEVMASADYTSVSSTSGDVEVEGRIREVHANTISGDIDVRADAESVDFKAISGDVDLAFGSDCLREINGSTISGDIDIDLPSGIGGVAINTQTRSGDVTTRCSTTGIGPVVSGHVSSMSGDITIR